MGALAAALARGTKLDYATLILRREQETPNVQNCNFAFHGHAVDQRDSFRPGHPGPIISGRHACI
jgi:hypothetical protein